MIRDHEALRDLADGYVLGGLTPEERCTFDAHLVTCEACADVVRELEQIAEVLDQTVEPRDPPADLRDRVLAVATRAPGGTDIAAQPPGGWGGWRWLPAAAALVALAVGLYALSLRDRVGALESALQQAREARDVMEKEILRLRDDSGVAARARMVLAARDLTQVDLTGQGPAASAHGRALLSPSEGLLFSAVGLPPLPSDRVYQLWIVAGATPISAGLLAPDAGRATLVTSIPPGVAPTQVAVTIEPAGGVPAPTGPMVLAGAL
ncbi:MAG: anti-sigma factor [Acidobacteria bacterium]|nr:anti-sigma factor [Acidobacteriota bacterium]